MKVFILFAILAISSAFPHYSDYDSGPDDFDSSGPDSSGPDSPEGYDPYSSGPDSPEDGFHFNHHEPHGPNHFGPNGIKPPQPPIVPPPTSTTTSTSTTTTTTTPAPPATTSAPSTTITTVPPTTTSAPPTTITTAPPTSTSAPTSTTNQPTIMECIKKCVTSFQFSPVCGTDGTTYMNSEHLQCNINCGSNISKLLDGPCPPPTTTTPAPTTTKRPTTEECLKTCPFSFDYSPVCGTDGLTYINIEFLLCNAKCGVAVQMLMPGMCSSTPVVPPPTSTSTSSTSTTTTTTTTPIPTTSSTSTPRQNVLPTGRAFEECIRNCMISQPESRLYRPACGTDGLIYINIQALRCTKQCGKNIDVMSLAACFNGPSNNNSSGSNSSSNESIDVDVRYGN